jgi:outer membrane protein TolC
LKKQAGLFPNPEFQFQNENLRPGQTYTRDVDTLAMINQPLDILGKRKQRVAVASEGVIRSQADYELARWQVSQQVKLAYWAARGSQEIREVLKTTADNFQKVVDYNSAQLSVGAIAEQDLLRVRLEWERLKILADTSFIEVNRSQLELLRAMGKKDFAEVVLTEPLAVDSEVVPVGVEQALAITDASSGTMVNARAPSMFGHLPVSDHDVTGRNDAVAHSSGRLGPMQSSCLSPHGSGG